MTQTLVRPAPSARPPARERALDGLRALAILGVVCGHWLVGALVPDAAGALHVDSPLRTLDWLAPATWLLQMLGLFFLVGGYAAAKSLARDRDRGIADRDWLRRRYVRLGWPVLVAAAAVAVALPVGWMLGVPPGTLRTWATLTAQPFWFIGVYAVVTALTPLALRLDDRFGWRAALPMAGSVALVDLARYGLDVAPAAAGYLTVLPAWMFTYQLGVTWARRGVDRRVAAGLLAGGAVLFAALLLVAHYPTSMVTVPGTGRSNSNPPSLLVPALAAAQAGAAILLRGRLEALLHRRPRLWTGVASANLVAMTLFCWHNTALVVTSAGAAALTGTGTGTGGVPGLTDAPLADLWVAQRLAWFPVFAAVLAGLVLLVGRLERPPARLTR